MRLSFGCRKQLIGDMRKEISGRLLGRQLGPACPGLFAAGLADHLQGSDLQVRVLLFARCPLHLSLAAEVYSEKIQPLLAGITNSSLASRIGVSRWYAGRIRRGYRPHPRHWQALAGLVAVSADG
jgi:hypothetical protein